MPTTARDYENLKKLSRRQPWLSLFLRFIDKLRIDSKEVEAEDDRGARLELWRPQIMALEQLAEGLSRGQHMFYLLKGRQQGLCYDPTMRVLTADLRWLPIGDIKIGDELIACDENINGRASRKMRTARVEGVREVQEWAFELEMDDGTRLIATGPHRHLCRVRGAVHTQWRKVSKTRIGDHIRKITSVWSDDRDYEDGWFGGIIDGEGSLSATKKGRADISISQVAGSVLERARQYLDRKGYNYREEIDTREAGHASKLGNQPVHRFRVGRSAELLKLIGVTRPTRFLPLRWWEDKNLPGKKIGAEYGKVVGIRSLGVRRMIDLQTSTKTYICEGYVSHNSTITLAILLFWVAVRPRTIAALVTNTDEVRDAFRNTLDRYVKSFPPTFFGDRFAKLRHNDKHFTFTNGSRIDYLTAGKNKVNWGESRGYSVCLCTEVADYGQEKGVANFIEALAQSHPNRLFMFESTAKGPNHWQDMWQKAEDEPTICRIFLGWWAHDLNRIERTDPRYSKHASIPPNAEEQEQMREVHQRFNHVVTMPQLAWWRWKLSTSDRQSAEQNQPWLPEQAFVLSGYSFFNIRKLQERYDAIYADQPLFKAYRFVMGNDFWAMKLEPIHDQNRYEEIELKVWEEPIREAQYVIGCDPAHGHSEESNNHCVQVFRCYADKLVQVAEFADHMFETKHCAWILAGLAGAYRNSMVNLELYGPGRVVMNEFDNIRIQLRAEIYNQPNKENDWDEDFMVGARWFLYRRIDNPGPGFVYNFETSAKRKFELFNLFRDVFTSNILQINSVTMLEEMANMVQEKADIAPASPGRQKDDRPFAAALAAWAWNEWIRNPMISAGATYAAVTAEAEGRGGMHAIVDRLVYSYFRRAEEAAEAEEDPWASDSWRSERVGL